MAKQSSASPSILEMLLSLLGHHEPRQIIVGLARALAHQQHMGQPSAFRGDPATAAPLAAAFDAHELTSQTPDILGQAWEALLTRSDRRQQGAHFTPIELCERVVELALSASGSEVVTVWDPACGGGAFLLAAARSLETLTGRTRGEIVSQIFASDIDPTALDVCDAALELWSSGQARPMTTCVDALLDLPADWPEHLDLIVGNPPFLGQLTADTSRSAERRAMLQDRFVAARGAYLDEAGLFVELSLQRISEGGVVALLVPESMLGARDAQALRTITQETANLASLWIDEGQSFAAAVDVVALILQRPTGSEVKRASKTSVFVGLGPSVAKSVEEQPNPATWAPLLAAALGVPRFELDSSAVLGDHASVTAGFRQHFYGITDAVEDLRAEETTVSAKQPQLITAGAIEPLRSLWGTRPVRFGGSKWSAPTLRIEAIADDRVRSWFEDRCRPKLLLASQTRVVEAIADPDGTMVPSVPVVSVEPGTSEELWHLAAALTSPVATAWMLRAAAGTGLSHDAIRIRASTLKQLPLPAPGEDWNEGARLAEQAQNAGAVGDDATYVSLLRNLAKAMNAAYGVEEHLGHWWWERVRLPAGFATHVY